MTNNQIAKLVNTTGKRLDVGAGPGVVVRVSADGRRKSFRSRLQRPGTSGSQQFLKRHIGDFNPPDFGIKQAIQKVSAMKQVLANGGEPEPTVIEKTPARRDAEEMTVGQLCERFLTELKPNWTTNTYNGYEGHIRKYIKPRWGDVPCSQLKYGTVYNALRRVSATKNAQSRSVYKTLSAVFSHGLILADSEPRLDRLHRHPLTGGKKKPGRKQKGRTRSFNNESLKSLVSVLKTYGLKSANDQNTHHREQRAAAQILHILLLTGQRKGEVRQMRWDDIAIGDDGTLVWTIPATITKNHDEHEVPVTSYVKAILDERGLDDLETRQHPPWVFPCRFHERVDEPLKNPKRAIATIYKVVGLTQGQQVKNGTTPHDLRRTVSQWLKTLRFSVEERGRLLNHSGMARRDEVTEAHYSDNETPEHAVPELQLKRRMLQTWNDHLVGIILGDEVSVRRAKRFA